MARYAILNGTTVVNIVEWDGTTPFPIPAGLTRRLATGADVIAPDPATAGAGAIVANLQQAMNGLQSYLDLANPTTAQNTQVTQLMARNMKRIIRYLFDQTDADT